MKKDIVQSIQEKLEAAELDAHAAYYANAAAYYTAADTTNVEFAAHFANMAHAAYYTAGRVTRKESLKKLADVCREHLTEEVLTAYKAMKL